MAKSMFIINDLDFMIKVWERAKANGKKPGDSVQEEFEQMIKEQPDAVTFLGNTDKDVDLLTGDLREQGIKVANLSEIERQNKNGE